MSKGAQMAGGATVVALLLAWYAITNLDADASFQYYQNLDEFQAAASQLQGQSLRVHGYVATDSIERSLEERRVRFSVQNEPPHAAGVTPGGLSVVYESLDTPDLFKDGAEVVLEGRLDGEVFVADNVLAKCPSKFEAKVGVERELETSI